MTLHIRDTDPNFEVETTKGPVRFRDWIDYRGLTPDQRQRMQHVVGAAETARAQALHNLGGAAVLRALQAAGGGGAAIIRVLAKAVIAGTRSEERRVGKECRRRGATNDASRV